MSGPAFENVLYFFLALGFAWTLYRVVAYTRKRNFSPALWGVLFESLSHYVQPQQQLKEPKMEINQVKKIPAEDEDRSHFGP